MYMYNTSYIHVHVRMYVMPEHLLTMQHYIVHKRKKMRERERERVRERERERERESRESRKGGREGGSLKMTEVQVIGLNDCPHRLQTEGHSLQCLHICRTNHLHSLQRSQEWLLCRVEKTGQTRLSGQGSECSGRWNPGYPEVGGQALWPVRVLGCWRERCYRGNHSDSGGNKSRWFGVNFHVPQLIIILPSLYHQACR